MNKKKYWPEPFRKSIGFYSDSKTFIDVLKYGASKTFFNEYDLIDLLSNRVIGLIFVKKISYTGVQNLIDELLFFDWIRLAASTGPVDNSGYELISPHYAITSQGHLALKEYEADPKRFYNQLIAKLHSMYIIPGWFIARLWDINSKDQGQVIIPSPSKSWNPKARKWEDNMWTDELATVTSATYINIVKTSSESFPISSNDWVEAVKKKWERLSKHIRKRKSKKLTREDGDEKNELYSPRKRLTMAMKEAAVQLLFSNYNINTKANDFEEYSHPLLPRKLEAWSSRLEDLGLIYYTDYNTKISGRILFPVSVFKDKVSERFIAINEIKDPKGRVLQIFKPQWASYKENFLTTLYDEYGKKHAIIRSMYVSIQEVRDEVCRILRINSLTFDDFLENAFNDSLNLKIQFRISLESDIREDQRSRTQLTRRPVYVNNKVVTIISITQIQG